MGKDVKSIIKPRCLVYCSLFEEIKKKRSTIEQASNEAFAKKSWRYPFANPDSIYIYTVSLTVKIKEMGKPASFYKDR